MKYIKFFLFVSSFVLFCQPAYSQNGVTFVGHLDQKHGTSSDNVSYSACWGYVAPNGREYAIVGTYTGTSIIDITSTDSIHEVTHISGPSSIWREMRTYKNRAYVVSEGGGGVQIINLANLPTSANLVRSFTYTSSGKNINRNHTIEIFDGYMYLNGSAGWSPGGVLIFSLANVDTPTYVGQYQQEYCHDSYVKGNRLYAAAINSGGLNIADISNKANPAHITKITYSGAGTHNAWTTADGNVVITTDEIGSTPKTLKFWNVQTIPPAPSSTIATYTVSPSDIVHNVFVRGNYAYVAWYTAGMAVVNIATPSSPSTAGFYDTSLEPAGNYDGVWAVYPYFWSGKIIAGDMQNGLYVLRFNDLAPRTPVSLIEPANQQIFCSASSVNFKWTRVADPAKDPHVCWFSLKGPGVDTTYILSSDTTFTLSNVSSLANGTYRWYITTKDEATQIATRDTFSFVKTNQFVAVTSPDTATSLKAESNTTITWSAGCVDSVELSYSIDNGASWNVIAQSLPATSGSHVWNIPNAPTTQGRIRVRSISDTTLTDMSNSAFTIYISTNVHVVAPNGGETWESGATRQISWTFLNVSNVAIEYTTNNGASWTTIISDTVASAGTYDWVVPEFGVTTTAKIRVKDVSNENTNDVSDAQFTILHISVMVHVLSPNGGEVWQIGSQQKISWSSLAVDSIAIEYSSNNGETWEIVTPAIASSAGSFLWSVSSGSASEALVRIRDLSDSSIIDVSDTTFHVPLMAMEMKQAWNLASVPLRPADSSINNLFQDAASQAFKYTGGYLPVETVTIGQGFWLKYETASTIPLYGTASVQETIDVQAKWNIIGSLSEPFPAASIEPIPNTMTLSPLYGFDPDSGYKAATMIQPGQGYWVKTSEAGKLALNSSSLSSIRLFRKTTASYDEVVFRDARGQSRALTIAGEPNNSGINTITELPPVPPGGCFDVRFSSQSERETITSEQFRLPVSIHSAEFPVTVTLHRRGSTKTNISLVERVNGEKIQEHNFNKTSMITLHSFPVGILILEARGNEENPVSFELGQNYPNPFNPTTTIDYFAPLLSPEKSDDGDREQSLRFISLKVYNVLGEEVATLVNEEQGSGKHSVVWDASKMPSGVYVYRLNAGNFSAMNKMILAK